MFEETKEMDKLALKAHGVMGAAKSDVPAVWKIRNETQLNVSNTNTKNIKNEPRFSKRFDCAFSLRYIKLFRCFVK